MMTCRRAQYESCSPYYMCYCVCCWDLTGETREPSHVCGTSGVQSSSLYQYVQATAEMRCGRGERGGASADPWAHSAHLMGSSGLIWAHLACRGASRARRSRALMFGMARVAAANDSSGSTRTFEPATAVLRGDVAGWAGWRSGRSGGDRRGDRRGDRGEI